MRQLNILVLKAISESKERTEAVRRRPSGIRWTLISPFYLASGIIWGLFWMYLVERIVQRKRALH
jgi:hypothetical protein